MKLLTDEEKIDLVLIPSCLINGNIGIAVGSLRKTIERIKGGNHH